MTPCHAPLQQGAEERDIGWGSLTASSQTFASQQSVVGGTSVARSPLAHSVKKDKERGTRKKYR